MEKRIEFGNDARTKFLKGIRVLYDAVKVTLGPNGKNVVIRRHQAAPSHVTKDGVTVAKEVYLNDVTEDVGAQVVKEATLKTAEIAGDGTTSATIIAAELIMQGIHHVNGGVNSVKMKRGIEWAAKRAIDYVKSNTKSVAPKTDEIKNIAMISANNDEEIGTLIADAMSMVNIDGTVVVENSKTGLTHIEKVEGLQIDRGYVSPFFITEPETMSAVMHDTFVLCCDMKVSRMDEIVPILEQVASSKKSLVIFAEEIEGDALAFMVLNKTQNLVRVAAVKVPGFGETRKELLRDIAAVTGANVISPEIGIRLDSVLLGRAEKITITRETTTILNGYGKKEDVEQRILLAKALLEETKYDLEKEQCKRRIARLSDGVAILYVGASTEIEMKEKKDRIDDALHATRAALEEGIVPGGGIAYMNAADGIKLAMNASDDSTIITDDETLLGIKIMLNALQEPFNNIMINGGENPEVIRMKIKQASGDPKYGYDARRKIYGDMFEMGVIDPAKVARIVIETAASVACTFLTTECAIALEKIDLKNFQMPK